MAHGPYPACQCLFSGPSQPNDFTVIFMVWRLVTRMNCLARFNYESGYTNVISSQRKVKQRFRNMREFLYIIVQKREVKKCGSLLMSKAHPGQPSTPSLAGHLSLCTLIIYAFSTALCGASTSVSFVISEFTCVLCSKRCCKMCKMLPEKHRKYESWSLPVVQRL